MACLTGPPCLSPPPHQQAIGKLRIRLSCVWPNTTHSASLPLLGERAKGAQVAGAVSLTLRACYDSTVGGGRGASPASVAGVGRLCRLVPQWHPPKARHGASLCPAAAQAPPLRRAALTLRPRLPSACRRRRCSRATPPPRCPRRPMCMAWTTRPIRRRWGASRAASCCGACAPLMQMSAAAWPWPWLAGPGSAHHLCSRLRGAAAHCPAPCPACPQVAGQCQPRHQQPRGARGPGCGAVSRVLRCGSLLLQAATQAALATPQADSLRLPATCHAACSCHRPPVDLPSWMPHPRPAGRRLP